MRLGAGRVKKGDAIDPAVGVVLDRTVGAPVKAGERLATVHARTADAAEAAAAEVVAAYTIGAGPPPARPLIYDVVGTEALKH